MLCVDCTCKGALNLDGAFGEFLNFGDLIGDSYEMHIEFVNLADA